MNLGGVRCVATIVGHVVIVYVVAAEIRVLTDKAWVVSSTSCLRYAGPIRGLGAVSLHSVSRLPILIALTIDAVVVSKAGFITAMIAFLAPLMTSVSLPFSSSALIHARRNEWKMAWDNTIGLLIRYP
ncbi:hypothetical protein EDC04DRAFT_2682387 [Pisolithus marmoratus]|nr:hypothetical protein EDC04DRAFT_2682387 [Pisolithus marmoratus]